jgi:hypothetical protein
MQKKKWFCGVIFITQPSAAEPQPNRIDSRKDAKGAKRKQDYKFETRNPKFETISNGQKSENSQQTCSDFGN